MVGTVATGESLRISQQGPNGVPRGNRWHLQVRIIQRGLFTRDKLQRCGEGGEEPKGQRRNLKGRDAVTTSGPRKTAGGRVQGKASHFSHPSVSFW